MFNYTNMSYTHLASHHFLPLVYVIKRLLTASSLVFLFLKDTHTQTPFFRSYELQNKHPEMSVYEQGFKPLTVT